MLYLRCINNGKIVAGIEKITAVKNAPSSPISSIVEEKSKDYRPNIDET